MHQAQLGELQLWVEMGEWKSEKFSINYYFYKYDGRVT